MARKKNRKEDAPRESAIHLDTQNSIWAVCLIGVSIILALSGFHGAGPIGEFIFLGLGKLFGVGYWLIPAVLTIISLFLVIAGRKRVVSWALLGAFLFVLAILGMVEIISPSNGGYLGKILGSLKFLFGSTAALILNATILTASIMLALNMPIKFFAKKEGDETEKKPKQLPSELIMKHFAEQESSAAKDMEDDGENDGEDEPSFAKAMEGEKVKITEISDRKTKHAVALKAQNWKDYVPPPVKLLKSSTEKPTVGDLRANANIIKRTLESFGIPVEMGEITIGPKVTRYTLKPAEGVKLSKITTLNQDLSLALAVHPIRIEAPIPGKSLVGIEIPNKTASIVRLGNLLTDSEFINAPNLTFVLGRDVAGEPILGNLAKMPHLLIAGTTGSGKSVMIHTLLISLIYKNSPETMRLILIDPKRVELSVYEDIPHLITPVIIDGKKAIAALRFAIEEMDRRYNVLLGAGCRDIASYNENHKDSVMPYIVIVIDELADLMVTFGREIENSIVRLAQMARATGIHLVLSTQRPSVEVITGLIKANINSRIALQVASQVDSRTILDMAGAEKLLGGGDMLFTSTELSKPKRIQGAFLTTDELNNVIEFVKTENKPREAGELESKATETLEKKVADGESGGDEDDMYDEAVAVVTESKKASASLLQRRLKVGYARAARLLDIMEENGVIGPGDGAKPREVYIEGDAE